MAQNAPAEAAFSRLKAAFEVARDAHGCEKLGRLCVRYDELAADYLAVVGKAEGAEALARRANALRLEIEAFSPTGRP